MVSLSHSFSCRLAPPHVLPGVVAPAWAEGRSLRLPRFAPAQRWGSGRACRCSEVPGERGVGSDWRRKPLKGHEMRKEMALRDRRILAERADLGIWARLAHLLKTRLLALANEAERARKQSAPQDLERTQNAEGNGAPSPGAGASPARLSFAEEAGQGPWARPASGLPPGARDDGGRPLPPLPLPGSCSVPRNPSQRFERIGSGLGPEPTCPARPRPVSGIAPARKFGRNALISLDSDSDGGAALRCGLAREKRRSQATRLKRPPAAASPVASFERLPFSNQRKLRRTAPRWPRSDSWAK
jgi:hypothetical protein